VDNVPDQNVGALLQLCVTLKAEIGVPLDQHFGINRAVGIMANSAAFAECLVLKNKRPGLLLMALGAALIQACHGKPARRFHNVHPVRIMALDAVHFPLNDRMMLGEAEFRAGFQMTLETGIGISARINDEFLGTTPAGHGDVLASRSVAGFTAALAGHFGVFDAQSRVRAGGEHTGNVGVAIETSLVANVSRAFDL
jgi:hypothetical protein